MLSLVIPAYNEVESLEELHQELNSMIHSEALEAEIVFIDDGSTDGTWSKIVELAARDSRVRGLRLRQNFGKAVALNAAFTFVHGDPVVTLDADLQDDLKEIPRMIVKLEEGFDLVSGWRRRRFDPWHKVFLSRLLNSLFGILSGLKLDDHNCGLKCYRAAVLKEIKLYGELHRFITIMAYRQGFRVTQIETKHSHRRHGHSKYGPTRLLKGLLDISTMGFLCTFRHRPIHLLGGMGLLAFVGGMLGLALLAIMWFSDGGPIGVRPLLIYSVASVLFGIQIIIFGILTELIIAYHLERGGKDDDQYTILERVGES